VTITKCARCGTVHDSIEAAIDCCEDGGRDDGDGVETDGGREVVDRTDLATFVSMRGGLPWLAAMRSHHRHDLDVAPDGFVDAEHLVARADGGSPRGVTSGDSTEPAERADQLLALDESEAVEIVYDATQATSLVSVRGIVTETGYGGGHALVPPDTAFAACDEVGGERTIRVWATGRVESLSGSQHGSDYRRLGSLERVSLVFADGGQPRRRGVLVARDGWRDIERRRVRRALDQAHACECRDPRRRGFSRAFVTALAEGYPDWQFERDAQTRLSAVVSDIGGSR
jgi:hypothetical protein